MKSKVSIIKKVMLSMLIILLGTAGATTAYGYYHISKLKIVKISKNDEDLGIRPEIIQLVQEEKKEKEKEVINIAFFGIDKRLKNDVPRSDSIMVVSIDEVHKKIKMCSIMRDTYVKVKGLGWTKLNHAYASGGPQLTIRTLNENFDLDIRNYAAVDFFNMEKIVDSLDGVNLDIKKEEIKSMNNYIREVAYIENKSPSLIKNPGVQLINGMQAVAYARIRNTAGGDFERADRQRTVLTSIFNKLQMAGKAEFASTVFRILPFTETSMNTEQILNTGMNIFSEDINVLEQERFPLDGYCKGQVIKGTWYLMGDLSSTRKHIHDYIYKDIKPVHKAPLF